MGQRSTKGGPGQLFCAKPFKWFEVSGWNLPKGDVYLCCPSWLETPVGNVQSQSVEEIWNGETAQAIRRSILDGSFAYCNASRCPFLQTVSGPVQHVHTIVDADLRAVIDGQLTTLPYGPREVNCAYDRSCNISCPSCRTELIVETEHRAEILAIQDKLSAEVLRDAHLLYITGSGDAFGSPFFNRWLRTMKQQDMPSLHKIHLHTNAQLWTPRMWGKIPEEIRALIRSTEISIDAACAETYAINRRGGSFERLLDNLAFVSQLRTGGPLDHITLSMVVQKNNFREMPAFVRLGQRFGADVIYFSQLVNWGTYSDEEFQSRAVHLPEHDQHPDFLAVLGDPIFTEETRVLLGNLTETRGVATA